MMKISMNIIHLKPFAAGVLMLIKGVYHQLPLHKSDSKKDFDPENMPTMVILNLPTSDPQIHYIWSTVRF